MRSKHVRQLFSHPDFQVQMLICYTWKAKVSFCIHFFFFIHRGLTFTWDQHLNKYILSIMLTADLISYNLNNFQISAFRQCRWWPLLPHPWTSTKRRTTTALHVSVKAKQVKSIKYHERFSDSQQSNKHTTALGCHQATSKLLVYHSTKINENHK